MGRELLSGKQRLFCIEYVKDENATRAYMAAGYKTKNDRSASTLAAILLTNLDIQAEIKRLRAEIEAEAMVGIKELVQELGVLSTSKVTDFYDYVEETRDEEVEEEEARRMKPEDQEKLETIIDGAGVIKRYAKKKLRTLVLKPSDQWPIDKIGAVAAVKQNKDGSIELKFYDKNKAIETLGRHYAMFTDNIKHSGEIKAQLEPDLSQLSNEELDALIALNKKALGNPLKVA